MGGAQDDGLLPGVISGRLESGWMKKQNPDQDRGSEWGNRRLAATTWVNV